MIGRRRVLRRSAPIAGLLVLGVVSALSSPTPAYAWERTLTVTFYNGGGYGDGKGHVTSDDGAIDCSYNAGVTTGDCSEPYIFADFLSTYDATLTLDPDPGSYVCLSTTNLCQPNGATQTFPIHFDRGSPGNLSVTPSFNLRVFRIQIDAIGPGTVTGNGAFCPVGGNIDYCGDFKYGATANLTAAPTSGAPFNGWEIPDNFTCFDALVCSFVVTANATGTAIFGLVFVTIDRTGEGTVCATGAVTGCTGGSFTTNATKFGQQTTLTASPAAGWTFGGWNRAPCLGQGAVCTFALTSDIDLTARFTKIATPGPTPTRTPSPSPAAPASPTPTVVPTPGASPAASTGVSGASPTATVPWTSGAAPSNVGPGGTRGPSSSPSPAGGSPSAVLDVFPLLALVLAAVVLALVGFALGRRGRSAG